MTEMLCITLSPTEVNTIVTCVSIGFSAWAAIAATIAACSIRTAYKKVKKAEFVVFVSKCEEVCANIIKEVLRYEKKSYEWNRDSAKKDKLSELAGLLTKLNRYYSIMSKNEKESLQSATQVILDSLGTMNEFAMEDDMEKFRDNLNRFDQLLQDIASEYQIYLLSD